MRVVGFILDPAVIRARGTAMLVSTVPMLEVVTVMYASLFRSHGQFGRRVIGRVLGERREADAPSYEIKHGMRDDRGP